VVLGVHGPKPIDAEPRPPSQQCQGTQQRAQRSRLERMIPRLSEVDGIRDRSNMLAGSTGDRDQRESKSRDESNSARIVAGCRTAAGRTTSSRPAACALPTPRPVDPRRRESIRNHATRMMAFVPGPLVTFRSLSGLTPPMGDGDFRPLAFGPERAMVVTYQWGGPRGVGNEVRRSCL